MPQQQSSRSHAALDPITHFILMPILLVNLGISIYSAAHGHHHLALHLWWIVLSIVLILLNMKTRLYSLRVQDRLIRLEERLRLTALLPTEEHALIHSLTTRQLIALRFADDSELPALARRALAENLATKQIKEAIVTWRPDNQRI